MTLYKCPECNEASTEGHWNASTAAEYGSDIVTVSERLSISATFKCPSCKSPDIDGDTLIEIYESASPLSVKIRKLHADAVVPRYATELAAGFDLVAAEDVVIAPGETAKIPLGLAFEIPPGYVMYVMMRSGIALKTKLRQSNGMGVIDADYRGEVAMMFDNITQPMGWDDTLPWKIDGQPDMAYEGGSCSDGTYIIRKGDRVCQAVIQRYDPVKFTVVDGLSETERGAGGFGHSGVN